MADDSAAATDQPPSPSQIVQNALPGILARAKVVINPYPFGLSDDSNLRITSVCSQTGVNVEVHYRLLLRDGSVKVGRFGHTPNSNRTAKSDDFNLAGGYVTNLSVFATSGSPAVGQVFVIVQLLNGLGVTATVMGTMLQGYVTTTQGLGWPGSPIQSSTDGEPNVRNILGTQPAAGAAVIETCPTGARWELITVFTQYVTSPVAATRTVLMQISTSLGPAALLTAPASANQLANQIVSYTWGQNLPTVVNNGDAQLNCPQRQFLRAGDAFALGAFGISAADQFSAPVYQVREWLEVP